MNDTINRIFTKENKKLVTFITGGDPDFNTSNEIIKVLIKNEVDIIEIGMPFSDPMADGPTIQLSSNRAINEGINLDQIFKLVSNAKNTNDKIPIILMGYYNIILHYGVKRFVNKCLLNGVNGLIIVDLQPEEDIELIKELKKNNIDLIRLITPTTDEDRLKVILKNASGFLYFVSVMGTTGQKSAKIEDITKYINFIKQHSNLPVVPGFGIKDALDVNNICKVADGAVVGSSIIKIIEENLNDKKRMLIEIDYFVNKLKNGTVV